MTRNSLLVTIMYFTHSMIAQAEARYGKSTTLRLNYPTPQAHFDFIRSTQKHGRAHDVTLYLYHEGRLAVTRKPMYPPHAFRPPSGGLHPGESLEEGLARDQRGALGNGIRSLRFHEALTVRDEINGSAIPGAFGGYSMEDVRMGVRITLGKEV